jgi:hypothetical protein
MHGKDPRKGYFLLADANALGGYLEEPLERLIPTLAPACLPIVGGLTTARSEEFHLDHIVGLGAAQTLVSGRLHGPKGSSAVLLKAVIERLNILDVVTADRIVTQLSITTFDDDRKPQLAFAGTSFHGLKIAGFACRAVLNGGPKGLGSVRPTDTSQSSGGAEIFTLASFSIVERIELVDGDGGEFPGVFCDTNQVDVPGFGRFHFGEGQVSQDLLQFVGVRAELGCPVKGSVAAGSLSAKPQIRSPPIPP